jgi:hypothetical protein
MNTVLHSFTYSLDFLREQVADIDPADMAAQPGGVVNHPAWVIGHLTYACQLLGRAIGLGKWLPDQWIQCFASGTAPVGDANFYPSKEDLLSQLTEAQRRMSERIEQLDDSQLDAPFPVESYRDVFPTIRHALTQVLIGHTAYHVGQVSVWRRAKNMPAMTSSYQ